MVMTFDQKKIFIALKIKPISRKVVVIDHDQNTDHDRSWTQGSLDPFIVYSLGLEFRLNNELIVYIIWLNIDHYQMTPSNTWEALKCKLDLVYLDNHDADDDTYLDRLDSHFKSSTSISLLDQNYDKLARILDKQVYGSQQRVLDLLDMCENKREMSDELLESLSLVFESTSSSKTKQSCLRLLSASGRSSEQMTSSSSTRVQRVLSEQLAYESVDAFTSQFVTSSAPLLGLFKEKLGLKDQQIEGLIRLINVRDRKLIGNMQSLEEFLDILVKSYNSSLLYFDSSFVLFVEQMLLISSDDSVSKIGQVEIFYWQIYLVCFLGLFAF